MPWPSYYILVGRTPIAVDMRTWAVALEKRHLAANDPWRVGQDQINNHCNVSTIFLGMDHRFGGDGDPVLFETLVFGGPLAGDMERYTTYADAERGHAEMVTRARIACAQVDAIASEAGAKE